jgi:hypothetical protein
VDMVPYLIGALVIAFLVFVVVGALTGRVKAQSCCSLTGDPDTDLRMRGAEASPDRDLLR